MPDRTLRILAVDDIPQNLAALVAGLDQPGVAVVTAPSAVAALELMLEQDFALALLDVQMPGMDGFELAEAMRGMERTRHIPIIFLTAVANDESRRFRGFEAGAVDYLLKPLEMFTLNRKVAVLIELARQRLELQQQRDDLALALGRIRAHADTSLLAVMELDHDLRITGWAQGAQRTFGMPADRMIGTVLAAAPFIAAAELPAFLEIVRARAQEGGSGLFEHPFVGPDGEPRHGEWHYSAVLSARGQAHSLVLQVLDITERHQAHQTQQLLIGELNHRVKNTLATIQAITNQTFRHSPDPAEFRAAFNGRVKSLALAHGILSASSWQGAALDRLVADQLAIGTVDPARFDCSGPAVELDPELALRLALVLHELVTNAHKYGALSNDVGTVRFRWEVSGGKVILDWRETGGPPLVAPSRSGFGTRLIEQSMVSGHGKVRIDYPATGLWCRMDFPIRAAAARPLAASSAPEKPAAGPPPDHGKRILVVEDEPLVALDILTELEASGHRPVGPAASVSSALQAIREEVLDFVLLDGNLNGEAVDDVADLLQQRGIPFAFVTGADRSHLPERHQARRLVGKPFVVAELHAAIAAG